MVGLWDGFDCGTIAPMQNHSEIAEFLWKIADLVKDDYEIDQMRRAIAATKQGFDDVVADRPAIVAHPRGERLVEGTFNRRARAGQFFHQPCLGCREFPASFELLEDEVPPSCYAGEKRELGYMLLDIDFDRDMTPLFFKAVMQDGVIAPPSRLSPEVRA